MSKTLLLFGLISASLFFNACQSASASDDSNVRNEQPLVEPTPKKSANVAKTPAKIEKPKTALQTANFKGVSFNYNPQVFDAVESEEVEESPLGNEGDKPDGVSPKHSQFLLKYKGNERQAIIKILPIADYRRMYGVSKGEMEAFDEGLANVQKALKDAKFRLESQVPILPFYDAHQTITARVKHFSFGNGGGIFFLTQYNQDFANLINNDELTYYYQGISADGKNYVWAEFPASAAFLPKDNQTYEFEGYKLAMNYDEFNEKAHKEYLAKVTKRLESLSADKFEPNLKYFEEIISTLKF